MMAGRVPCPLKLAVFCFKLAMFERGHFTRLRPPATDEAFASCLSKPVMARPKSSCSSSDDGKDSAELRVPADYDRSKADRARSAFYPIRDPRNRYASSCATLVKRTAGSWLLIHVHPASLSSGARRTTRIDPALSSPTPAHRQSMFFVVAPRTRQFALHRGP